MSTASRFNSTSLITPFEISVAFLAVQSPHAIVREKVHTVVFCDAAIA